MDLGAFRDRLQHELPRVVGAVGDLDLEAAGCEGCCGAFELRSARRPLELEIGAAGVRKGEGHAVSSSTVWRSSARSTGFER